MKVYERIIAQSIPPTNGSVIWINTSQMPYTVNIFANGAWNCMGAMHDSELLQRILDIIGSPSSEERTIAGDLQLVINKLDNLDIESVAKEETSQTILSTITTWINTSWTAFTNGLQSFMTRVENTLSNLSKEVENDTRDAFSSYTMLQMLEDGIDIPNIIYSEDHGGCYIRTGRQRTVSGELQSEWVGVEGDDRHKVFVWGAPYEDPAVLFSENGQYYDSVDSSRAAILPTRDDISAIGDKVGTPLAGQPSTLFGAIAKIVELLGTNNIQASTNKVVNGYQVPDLTPEQVTQAYNSVVAGRSVTITDATGNFHLGVTQADVLNGDLAISLIYLNAMLLTYEISGSTVDIQYKNL